MASDSCLDEDTALAYVQRLLPDGRVAVVEHHLDQCEDCLDLVGVAVQEISATRMIQPDCEGGRAAGEAAPLHRSFGRYRIIDLLGHGGMGLVYRAALDGSAETVALKTVRVHDPGAVASIRREIHALSQVRHPGVVKVLEQGIDAGCPWYTMELIEGQTLDSYLEKICRTPALTVRSALRVLQKLSLTLAHLHGMGFVHRDLTPFNVLIRPDDTPVLVDFGLALESAFAGRDVLDRTASAAGTLAYMAPEQFLGERADARVDLYALGCILYKAVTGRPPFIGNSISALCRQHLSEAPLPPSELAPGIPPQLEALILRLLEKLPSDRVGYAEDVAAALADIVGDGRAGRAEAAGRPRPYVYRPLFSGRDEWIVTFDERIDRLHGGTGGQVYVGGESGIGKTRLVAEVAARARRSMVRIITGEGAAMGAEPGESTGKAAALHPLRPLLRTIAEACRDGGRERADRLVGPRAKVLSTFEPSLLELPGHDAHPDPPELSGQAALHRILSALEETIAAYAAEAPLLLCLDDLQWADELSLRFLESLKADFFAETPVLVIGTYRTEENSAALERVVTAPFAERISLGRIALPAIRAMIGDMLALDEAPLPLCDLLAKESDGNPFFITEHVRAAVEEEWLKREGQGRWVIARSSSPPTPGSLKELTRRRLSSLSPLARRVVEVAAVLGLEAEGEMIVALAGLADTESLEAEKELLTRCVLEELPRGRLRFAHAKLREAAYEGVPLEQRCELHLRAATSIEQRAKAGGDASALYPILAHHWICARVFDKAIECLERAGDAALAAAAYGEAAASFERAIELSRDLPRTPEEIERRAKWARRLGEAYYALGDLPRCEQHSREALAGLGHPLPTSRAGWVASLLSEAAVQAAHLLRPDRVVSRAPLRRAALKEAAVTAARVTHSYYFADDALAILASSLLSVNLIERAGVDARVARPYAQLGYLAGVLHLDGLADAYFARSRASAHATNAPEELAVALYTEATYQLWSGDGESARATGTRALSLLQEIKSPQETEIVETILAHVDYCAGRYEDSMARCAAIVASARVRANIQHEAWGLYADARNLIRLQRFKDAADRLILAQGLLLRQSDRASDIISTGLLSFARLSLGEDAAAEGLADATMKLIGRAPPAVFSVGDGYSAAAEVYLELWKRRGMSVRLAAKVERAWEALLRFAISFRFGRPSFLLYTGQIQALLGIPHAAAPLFRRAIDEAEAMNMPFEAALGQERLREVSNDHG